VHSKIHREAVYYKVHQSFMKVMHSIFDKAYMKRL